MGPGVLALMQRWPMRRASLLPCSGWSDFPESAPLVDWRHDGVRKRTAGGHVALYRVEGNTVRVLRILHQRMEPTRHL